MASNLTPSTRNVTRVFRSATPEQVAGALDWYGDAHRVASALAVRYGVTVEVASGVIAALSPLNSWGANVNLAARFLEAGGLTAGYLKVGLVKATRILAGEDILTVLGSDKVSNFYLCILHSGATDGVCVDRHAYDIAVNTRHNDGNRPTLKGKRYADVADVYRQAARILSREVGYKVHAAQVQSVTWVAWRARYWAAGAFDGHTVEV